MTILQASDLTHAAMLGLGVYRPERVVTNDEICEVLDSSDEWIQSRSGIKTRRFAGPDEDLITMATKAAERALAVSGVGADQLGCVIVATSTYPEHTPASAPQVADRLGSTTAAFDISAGCAGFCHGLNLASSMVRSGAETYVLVIGVEQLSRFMDPTDRGTAFIFADGAGAVVVGPADAAGIGPTAWGSDGSQAHVINQTPSCLGGGHADHPVVQMEGTAVFRWAPFAMAEVAHEAPPAPASPWTTSTRSFPTRPTCASPRP
jgi:3-oxoacyl-[acyl-carrier-protein] synthase-3/beta-ketoacyl ACP synthase